ncbi:MAG: hypothetical protein Q4B70_13865 [Lachnospiraceae bacterium]|nr:hypothetical protein [Lachnospiraceae bacterium]
METEEGRKAFDMLHKKLLDGMPKSNVSTAADILKDPKEFEKIPLRFVNLLTYRTYAIIFKGKE